MLHLDEVWMEEIYARDGIVVERLKRGKEVVVRKLPSLHGGARGAPARRRASESATARRAALSAEKRV